MKDALTIVGYLAGTALAVGALMLVLAIAAEAVRVPTCGWYTIECEI